MKKWIKLERGNDWGVEYLTCPGQARSGPHNTADARRGIFQEGRSIEVRWPNGFESTEKIKHRTIRGSVSDHGKPSSFEFSLAGIEMNMHGITRWVALDEVEIYDGDTK
jgi:hypothetical protein